MPAFLQSLQREGGTCPTLTSVSYFLPYFQDTEELHTLARLEALLAKPFVIHLFLLVPEVLHTIGDRLLSLIDRVDGWVDGQGWGVFWCTGLPPVKLTLRIPARLGVRNEGLHGIFAGQ